MKFWEDFAATQTWLESKISVKTYFTELHVSLFHVETVLNPQPAAKINCSDYTLCTFTKLFHIKTKSSFFQEIWVFYNISHFLCHLGFCHLLRNFSVYFLFHMKIISCILQMLCTFFGHETKVSGV